METKRNPVQNKTIDDLTPEEWEIICDRCARCCLQKFEDVKTGTIRYTGVACEFLDVDKCECLVYENRHFANPDCIALTPENIRQINWLPATCAYRRLAEGRRLEWWHPLNTGDSRTVHEAGISIRDKAVSGRYCHVPDEDIDIEV
jgi:uncharacterized cysteine cluster protein YcgN (CxxCxxCC family)